jgi:hypothetical protein
VVPAILLRVERDREELLLQGPLVLPISPDRNFLAAPVSAEQAPAGFVALGIRGNNLDGMLQACPGWNGVGFGLPIVDDCGRSRGSGTRPGLAAESAAT